MIRVLVADDSPTSRALLVAMLKSDPDFTVVGEARDGFEALQLAKALRPHVVTMDVTMPRMGGLEATRCIMVHAPTPIVIVSATLEADDVAASMRAIRAGALTAIGKPSGPASANFEQERARFLTTVKAMASVKVVGHRLTSITLPAHKPGSTTSLSTRASIVALAASTGGPGALRSVLDALPYDFGVPVVLVQHLAPGFLEGFTQWLGATCRLHVQVASEGMQLSPRNVYVAPEDRHLKLSARGVVELSSEPPIEAFRPSASVLFESVAQTYGRGALAAILTGMGRDGVAGLRRVRELGGRVIAQDEQTCSVFGMPAAAIEEGLVDFVLPISLVPAKLIELVAQESR